MTYSAERIHMIPYPYNQIELGDKGDAKKSWNSHWIKRSYSPLISDQKTYGFIDLHVRPLPTNELYIYLHASDALLIHRESSQKYKAVVSSSVCQVLGSGCPILFQESNFVESYGNEN